MYVSDGENYNNACARRLSDQLALFRELDCLAVSGAQWYSSIFNLYSMNPHGAKIDGGLFNL